MNVYTHISTVVVLTLKMHMCCMDLIQVDGMLNDLVSAWYENASICVISQLDSDARCIYCSRRHIGR